MKGIWQQGIVAIQEHEVASTGQCNASIARHARSLVVLKNVAHPSSHTSTITLHHLGC